MSSAGMSDVTLDSLELSDRYDRISNAQYKLGLSLIEKMGAKEGDATLDVGCGTGRLALSVWEMVSPSGRVVGLDPSPHRVQIANGKLSGRPNANLEFAVGVGEDLGNLSDDSFDAVYFSSVLHWINDKKKALIEAKRVLKPGGKIGITMPSIDVSSTFRVMTMEILSRPPYAELIKGKREASMTITSAELKALLIETGFSDLILEIKEERKFLRSARGLIMFYEASSFGNFLRFLPESLRESLKCDLVRELERKRTAEGIEIISSAVIAIAVKPNIKILRL